MATLYSEVREMHFTNEEKENLKKCRDEIAIWIEQNIIPHLGKDERIKYDFGGAYYDRSSYDSEGTAYYHFSVWSNPIRLHNSCGGFNGESNITFSQQYGYNDDFRSLYNPYQLFPIVKDWVAIKSYLLGEVRRLQKLREEKTNLIQNFVV